nr:metallophosphoesterase [candidate division Zixibacteria bacterium]
MMWFFFIAVAILSLMYGYIGWRLIIPAAFSLPVNLLLWGLLLIFLILFFLPNILQHNEVEGRLIDILSWAGYLSFGFLTLLFAFLVVRDVVLLIGIGLQKLIPVTAQLIHPTSSPSATELADPERRHLLINTINLGLAVTAGAMTGYGLFEALRRPKIVDLTIPIRNLPPVFEGFRIVQITDIHVSSTIKEPFVRMVVDMVNDLKPDLVALTGDLVDGSVPRLRGDVAPLADLKAPYGRYFITGNHEYYSGVLPWLAEIKKLGFDILLNEHRVLERDGHKLILAGVTDYSGGEFLPDHKSDPHRALAGAPEGLPRILLAHQPKNIFEAARAGYDYVISGHTHGGQYFPYHFLAALAQPYISGMHRHEGTLIYISRGTGYWGPQIRIGARSEITVHHLVAGKSICEL